MRLITLKEVFGFCTVFLISIAQAKAQAGTSTAQSALAILEKRCHACHGATQMSGLDLRQRETLLKGGKRGPALVPRKAEDSLLYKAVKGSDGLKMPPG